MSGISHLFFLLIGVILLVSVFRLVRNLKLREKYAALWLVMGLVVVALMIFPGMLDWLADVVGVATPVNLLFLFAIVLLIGVVLHLSLEISRLEDETRVLAEEAAIQRSLLDRQTSEMASLRNPTSSNPRLRVDHEGRAYYLDETSEKPSDTEPTEKQ